MNKIKHTSWAVALTAIAILNSCKKEPSSTLISGDPGAPTYLASSTPSNKVALLEDFTGVKCTWCPTGHRYTENYITNNPGKLIVIATQTSSSYGVPYSGESDLRTSFASALESNGDVAGYPGGTISRTVFTDPNYGIQQNGGMAMTLTAGYPGTNAYWYPAVEEITAQTAPVNIGIKSTYDSNAGTLTITVETYYTSSVTENLYLHVALKESELIVKQIDMGIVNPDYVHKDVLRDYITGQWGEQITTATTQGTRTQKTYTYTLSSAYNVDNCKIVAFVSEDKKNVLNAAEIAAK